MNLPHSSIKNTTILLDTHYEVHQDKSYSKTFFEVRMELKREKNKAEMKTRKKTNLLQTDGGKLKHTADLR